MNAHVFVVEDDDSIRKSLTRLLHSAGYQVETFGKAEDFLTHNRVECPSCLILDVQLPGLTGLNLQEALISSGGTMPIIFISAHATVPMSVKAMKLGAVDFLLKPFKATDLLTAVERALENDLRQKKNRQELETIQTRFNRLTPRERQVLWLVVNGKLNKQVAAELGTSEKTIKVHRARVMQKMEASSLAELVQLAHRIQTH
jgi:FixJ family two-component response regulator